MTTNTRFDSTGLFDSCGRLISTLPATSTAEQQQTAQSLTPVNETANIGSLPTGDSVAPEIPSEPKTSQPHAATHEAIGGVNRVVVVQSKQTALVTNANFVAAIFGILPAGISPAVCTKYGDPTNGGWPAMKAGNVDLQCLPNWNNYVNCSSFYEDEYGNVHARKDKFYAFHFILLDDMGTKVPWSHLNGFKPSFVIETSPGNYQAVIILAEPLTDISLATQLVNALIAKGLTDPGATGVARWARSPKGINGKAKYKSESGEPFQCHLSRSNQERRYTVEEIVVGLNLELSPHLSGTGDASQTTTTHPTREIDPAVVARIPQLLNTIDPDCDRPDWIRVLMAVFHTTGGSDDGLAMVDAWSSKGKKYRGTRDIETQWRSFRSDVPNPVTIGTLIKMARKTGANVDDLMKGCDHFEYFDTEVVGAKTGKTNAEKGVNPLAKYSLLGQTQKLESQVVDEKCILGNMVLQGQAAAFFAPPNMGKTAITIGLICKAISAGFVDPKMVFYINLDDNGAGLVAKNKLADEYKFNMLADGHQGFELAHFNVAMEEMIANETAKGVVIILDTLKRIVNPMAKDDCRKFTKMARRFSMKGGTVIALAHVNKNRNTSGKVVYAGTSDVVDDFDCAYTLDVVAEHTDANTKVVEFSNIKKRGSVALSAAYSYSVEPGLSYEGLILSIQAVDSQQLKPLKQASDVLSDAAMIGAIVECITNGINTKMKLVEAAAERVKASKRLALKMIEKYTGEDPAQHRWMYVVRDRGAKVYELLQPPSAPSCEPVHPAPVLPEPEGTSAEPIPLPQHQANAVPEFSDAQVSVGVDPTLAFHAAILEESIQQYGGGGTGSEVDISDTY